MGAKPDRRRALLALTFALAALRETGVRARQGAPDAAASAPMTELLRYAQAQRTTGFLVMRKGAVLVERNWPLPSEAGVFKRAFTYGVAADGALLEDVASAQKSFVSVLAGIAVDKGLLDIDKAVSAYLADGWSKAPLDAERRISVRAVLEMNSGLKTDFTLDAAPGTKFLYNTEVYAVMKPILAAASRMSLDDLTEAWLTLPLSMADTGWRLRPSGTAAFNPTGLVTSPRDAAKLGTMILAGGAAPGGRQVVSAASLARMFQRSATNPAYGQLWWLNGGDSVVTPEGRVRQGPLIAAAPKDLIAALGAADRKLYVVPSLGIVVVRLGQAAPDKNFDEGLWTRLTPVLE